MGERELREKYGGKIDKAINRAIRAETPGGNAALDTLTKLSGPAWRSGWTDASGNPTPEAQAYLKHQKSVVDPLIAKIRKTYGLPPADPSGIPNPKRKRRPAWRPGDPPRRAGPPSGRAGPPARRAGPQARGGGRSSPPRGRPRPQD